MRKLTDRDPEWSRLQSISQRLVKVVDEIAPVEIETRHWVSVARPAQLFNDDDMARDIASAVAWTGSETFFAVNLELVEFECYELIPNESDILAFAQSNSYFRILFTTLDERFAFITTLNEYLIGAGDTGFIDRLSGGDRARAVIEFSEFACGRAALPEYMYLLIVAGMYNK